MTPRVANSEPTSAYELLRLMQQTSRRRASWFKSESSLVISSRIEQPNSAEAGRPRGRSSSLSSAVSCIQTAYLRSEVRALDDLHVTVGTLCIRRTLGKVG